MAQSPTPDALSIHGCGCLWLHAVVVVVVAAVICVSVTISVGMSCSCVCCCWCFHMRRSSECLSMTGNACSTTTGAQRRCHQVEPSGSFRSSCEARPSRVKLALVVSKHQNETKQTDTLPVPALYAWQQDPDCTVVGNETPSQRRAGVVLPGAQNKKTHTHTPLSHSLSLGNRRAHTLRHAGTTQTAWRDLT